MPGADSLELCPQQPQRRAIIVPILQLGKLRGQGLAPCYPMSQGILTWCLGPSLSWGCQESKLADAALPLSP